MAAPEGEYHFSALRRVVYGPGSLRRLNEVLGDAHHVLLVTGRTLSHGTPVVDTVRKKLGDSFAGLVDDVGQFAPVSSVERVASRLANAQIDAVLSLGGGSVIDTVKAAIHHHEGLSDAGYLPHFALPTTLSAAEFAASYGVTDDLTRDKTAGYAPELAPREVILDARLTSYTPNWLWYGSGMRALDHAVETVYAPNHNPVSDATALSAMRALLDRLPVSGISMPASESREMPELSSELLAARQECQIASWLSFFGPDNVSMGMSHRLGRKLGPRFNIPHGHTSAILLPHAVTYQQRHAPDRTSLIAAAMKGADSGATEPEPAEVIRRLVSRLGLPGRLRDVGVPEGALPELAAGDARGLQILRAAW